jgi:hypothetical protein
VTLALDSYDRLLLEEELELLEIVVELELLDDELEMVVDELLLELLELLLIVVELDELELLLEMVVELELLLLLDEEEIVVDELLELEELEIVVELELLLELSGAGENEPGGGIVGASGLLLGLGEMRGIKGVCLMGETPGYLVDPKVQSCFEYLTKITNLGIKSWCKTDKTLPSSIGVTLLSVTPSEDQEI